MIPRTLSWTNSFNEGDHNSPLSISAKRVVMFEQGGWWYHLRVHPFASIIWSNWRLNNILRDIKCNGRHFNAVACAPALWFSPCPSSNSDWIHPDIPGIGIVDPFGKRVMPSLGAISIIGDFIVSCKRGKKGLFSHR